MNLAFPALLVFLLVLPGIVFRYSYARGSWGWASPTSLRSISDEIAYGVVFAGALHVLWVLISNWFGASVDFAAALALLTGDFGPNGNQYERAIRSVADHPTAVASYFLTLYAAAAVFGNRAHALVRHYKLDLRTQIFRFRNEWYYLLTGEALSFTESSTEVRDIDGVYLSGIIEHGGKSYLYRGVVEDFSFDSEGALSTVRLRAAHRRELSKDRTEPFEGEPGSKVPPDERYYDIRGDLFIVRFAELKTLNLDYFSLTPEADEQAQAETGQVRE